MTIDLFFINKIIVLLIDALAIWLGFWVYFSNSGRATNKIFISMTFFMLLWVNFAYLARETGESNPSLSLFFLKIAWFATPLFFVHLYILVLRLLDEDFKYKLINKIIVFLGVTLSFITGFTGLIVSGIKFMGVFLIRLVYGPWMLPFLAIISLLIAATLYPLLKEFYSRTAKERRRLEYFLAGIVIFYAANIIFNIILPIVFDITRFYFLGDYSTVLLLGFTAYAIVKQNLFGIKIFLTALLVGFISILLSLDILIFTESFTLQLFKLIALAVFLYLGRELIRSVLKEDERLEELERVSRNLTLANQKLRNLLAMKNDFLHIVSHQLRTPLTSIRGFISMWNEKDFDDLPPEKMAEIKARIVNNTERLNNIVNGMVTAMESEGDLKANFQPVDIEKILQENIEMLKPSFEKRNLYLKYKKVSKNIPKIEADEKLLLNVFMNLIDNAEKYTDKGGLSIEVKRKKNNVNISFIDTGAGLSKDDKKILFKKFSRGKKSSHINPNGSGLGLFIVKQIIAAHRGKIKAISEGEGKGTTFAVTLPVKQVR